MSIPIQKYREVVFQLLYSSDMGLTDEKHMVDMLSQELSVSKKNVRDAQQRVHLIRSHLSEIDRMIAEVSKSYDFERIHSVERNILRLSVFELHFDNEKIPHKVVIAEAMRLARKFGTKESASFINAILDNIHKNK